MERELGRSSLSLAQKVYLGLEESTHFAKSIDRLARVARDLGMNLNRYLEVQKRMTVDNSMCSFIVL